MISPTAMLSRAFEIERLCGGHPSRAQLANPTPEVQTAWTAHRCAWSLTAARGRYEFLHQRRLTIWWLYRAHAEDRRLARANLRNAAMYLREAEGRLAVINSRNMEQAA